MSSRRSLPSKQAGMTVACGWDNPLQTYFCTVLREPPSSEEDADTVVLWLGLDRREVRTPEEMASPLAPYADLDALTIRLLRADRDEDLDRGPTALQRRSLVAFGGGAG
ncbi:hypothetical protein [uncultured Enterovirga sp.]|uniref:hypothetical protein n=1 Tax=uncultured Enterovirga sp. TaxID=2026352 RepID=UPI0035CAFBAB